MLTLGKTLTGPSLIRSSIGNKKDHKNPACIHGRKHISAYLANFFSNGMNKQPKINIDIKCTYLTKMTSDLCFCVGFVQVQHDVQHICLSLTAIPTKLFLQESVCKILEMSACFSILAVVFLLETMTTEKPHIISFCQNCKQGRLSASRPCDHCSLLITSCEQYFCARVEGVWCLDDDDNEDNDKKDGNNDERPECDSGHSA